MAEASWKILVDVLLRERFLPDTVWPKLALSSKHLFGLAASEATRLHIEWHTYLDEARDEAYAAEVASYSPPYYPFGYESD